MKIKVDIREIELLKAIIELTLTNDNYKGITVTSENLPLGDVIICDDTTEKIIIERKTIQDLSSSIKDGRYDEQSYRLCGIGHERHNIIYLIEGDFNTISNFKYKIDKQTMFSAIFSLNYYKGFSVIRTINIHETAFYICNTLNKLIKGEKEGRSPYYSHLQQTTDATNDEKTCVKSYATVIKKVKKDNITQENIGEIMLCQIPGISSTTASAIMKQFKTIPNLLNEISKDDTCLKDITYANSKGYTRKINKNSIENIKKFLFNSAL